LRYHDDVQELRRITIDPGAMGGKPCIRRMRVTVGMMVEAIAACRTREDLLKDFPYLEEHREALAFAASLAQGREVHRAWFGIHVRILQLFIILDLRQLISTVSLQYNSPACWARARCEPNAKTRR